MRFRRHFFLASVFLLTPAVALIVVGILVLAFQRETVDVTFGVLILSFCAALLAGTAWLVVSLKREASLSQLQLDFLSKVSHEFKTPLTSIRMFAETLAQHRALNEEQQDRCVTMLRQESDRLRSMIERWLDFGRMAAGKMEYHPTATTVEAVVDAALRAFEPIRLQAEVRLTTELAPGLPPISVDAEMMAQALLNLLQNASKYGGDTKAITLRARAARGHVALTVRDHGPGIPRKERRRIFDYFYRIDDRLNRRQDGSGLGLAIVRHVVQSHGGRIRVRNHPGGGAEFTILLPQA
jgi:two-component system phosphate regulon sensor histidine kinase PhoR